LFLVMSSIGAVWLLTSLVHSLQSADATCLPTDFPRYPGATIAAESFEMFGPNIAPGDTRKCVVGYQTSDDQATVTDYFASRLEVGDWRVTATNRDAGQIKFRRISKPSIVGTIDIAVKNDKTRISISLDS
jgi:hypothetical protein